MVAQEAMKAPGAVAADPGLYLLSGAVSAVGGFLTSTGYDQFKGVLEDAEARQELLDRLRRLGVQRALTRAGVEPGELVQIGAVELRWE